MLKVILQIFSRLLDKLCGRNHKYRKIFSRNNVKISYSCIDNIKDVTRIYNKEICITKQMVKHPIVVLGRKFCVADTKINFCR